MPKAPKVKWLERGLLIGPHLCLVKTEAEWTQAFHDLDESPSEFSSDAGRCVTLTSQKGQLCAIVLIQADDRTPIEVAGLIVHEAVHVVQAWAAHIGEKNIGDETQAYVTQTIAQRLMAQWCGQEHA